MAELGLLIEIMRKAALWSNVDIAFSRILPSISDAAKNPLKEEIENKTIGSVGFYCYANFDGVEKRWMELVIEFSWDLHEKFILNGGDKIRIPQLSGYPNGITAEAKAAVNMFLDIRNQVQHQLSNPQTWYWILPRASITQSERQRVGNKLGLTGTAPPSLPGSKKTPPEFSSLLPEQTFGIEIFGN